MIGKAGVSICSIEDMKVLFDGIPLNQDVCIHDYEWCCIAYLGLYIVADYVLSKKRWQGRFKMTF